MPEPAARKGWTRVAFGDVVQQVRDRVDPEDTDLERYVAGEHMDTDDLRIRRWGLIGEGYLGPAFHMRFKPGHVLYGSRRTYLRKVAVADFEGITANTTFVIETKDPGILLPELLPFIMQTESFHEHSIKQSKGSVNPYVNFSDLTRYEFALPPLGEQQRMAAALGAADSVLLQLDKLKGALERAMKSFAHSCFSRSRWPDRNLGELLDYASDGPFGSKIKTEHYSSSGARVIRLNNIDVNRFNDEDKAFLSLDYFAVSLKSYEVRPGDVVVAGLGDESIPAGRACLVPDHLGPAVNKADCFCLRPGANILPRFLAFFLNSPRGLAQSAAFSQGTTRLRLNLGNIRQMTLPVPPITVQKEISRQLSHFLETAQRAAARQQHAASIRATLLAKLLDRNSVI
jgi:type I restriction enzyme, S subunit